MSATSKRWCQLAINFKLYPKQQRAIMTPAQEVLYGGAAGAGKSYLMRVCSIILCLEIPNFKVFLFRRLHKELLMNHVFAPDGYLTMMKPLIDAGDVVYNKSDGVFTFYNGSQIYLCHAQHENDIQIYLGAEMHLLLVDEATQFTEKMIRFIRTRVRLGGLPVPDKWKHALPKILYCTNPGGVSHTYFKKGFVRHGSGHVFKAPVTDGGMSREFIHATHKDNHVMIQNDPNYGDRIRGLGDEKMAEAFLKGTWDIDEGSAFGEVWEPSVHVVKHARIPSVYKIDRSHDYGYSAPAATIYTAESDGTECELDGKKIALPRKSLIVVGEIYFADEEDKGLKLLPTELGRRMKVYEQGTGLGRRCLPGPADNSIFDADKGYKAIHDDYKAQGVSFTRSDKRPGSRERGFLQIKQMLHSAKTRNPELPWLLFVSTCTNCISQLPELPLDPENPMDVNTNANDHMYDGIRYRVLKHMMKAEATEFLGY